MTLEMLAAKFQASSRSRRKDLERLFFKTVQSGKARESSVFGMLDGLPFPIALCFFEPPAPLAENGFRLDRCPRVQIGSPRQRVPFAEYLVPCFVESALEFLRSEQLQERIYVGAIAADGRGAAFRARDANVIQAWSMLASDEAIASARIGVA